MTTEWRFEAVDSALVERLSQATGLPPLVTQLLVRRQMTDVKSLEGFLAPKLTSLRDPELLPGCERAAELIVESILARDPIVIFGDYDADGMNGTAILFGCLKRLGADVSYFIPSRIDDGYGLSNDALERLASRGKRMVISVDCGITAVEQATLCKRLGMKLVITDHHQFSYQLPQADAIVHPGLPGHTYPFAGLCGAAVAFKLAWATSSKMGSLEMATAEAQNPGAAANTRRNTSSKVTEELRQYLLSAIGMASIATIADVVPLVDENRVLVSHGLRLLQSHAGPGMQALLEVSKLDGKSGLQSDDIGFGLAPRLNAAGRLGQAQLAVELLTTQDPQRAKALAVYIDKLNQDRMTLERSIQKAATKQARQQLDEGAPAIVVADSGWHVGVIGVVAGRLAEKFHVPTIVIALDAMTLGPGTGSARTPGYLNLHETLAECSDHLVSYGGHAAAAGLRVEPSRLDAFREAFYEAVASRVGESSPVEQLTVDAEATLGQLDLMTISSLDRLAPFGPGNKPPVFVATGVQLASEPVKMGKSEQHFSVQFLQYGKRMRAVAFGQSDWVDKMQQAGTEFDILFQPKINEHGGFRRVELYLRDWRPHQASNLKPPHFSEQDPKIANAESGSS